MKATLCTATARTAGQFELQAVDIVTARHVHADDGVALAHIEHLLRVRAVRQAMHWSFVAASAAVLVHNLTPNTLNAKRDHKTRTKHT